MISWTDCETTRLALNTFVAAVTESSERTGYLGRLQGCNMFGSAVGFLAGGILADVYDIITPFQVTLVLFCLCTVYVYMVLPYESPEEQKAQASEKSGSVFLRAFGPLSTIMPAKWITKEGRVQREYGALILAAGVFLAVLATGYIPVLLQMYAMSSFGFTSLQNSYLTSMHLLLRGAFLVLAFPKIIAGGRRFMEKRDGSAPETSSTQAIAQDGQVTASNDTGSTQSPDAFTATSQARVVSTLQGGDPDPEAAIVPVPPPPETTITTSSPTNTSPTNTSPTTTTTNAPSPSRDEPTYAFDLIFVRTSLLLDGALTLLATFTRTPLHLFLISAILPLGAGTASAAKGVILQMSPASDRTDALAAISLVEMMARLLTTFVFGLVFAAFVEGGWTEGVFVVNAAVCPFS